MADNTSFLPEDYLQRKIARRTNVICLSLFGVVVVGVVGAFFVTDRQGAEIRREQEAIRVQYEEAATRIKQLEELQARKTEMIRKAQVAAVLVERVPRSLVMAELINHMPPSLSLTEFDLDTKIVRMKTRPKTAIERQQKNMAQRAEAKNKPEVLPTRVSIHLVGVAPTDVEVSTFINRLNRHPMFEEVSLAFSENAQFDERTMRRFRVEMVLNQDLDMAGIEPTKVARTLTGNPMSDKIQIDAQGNLIAPDPTRMGAVEAP